MTIRRPVGMRAVHVSVVVFALTTCRAFAQEAPADVGVPPPEETVAPEAAPEAPAEAEPVPPVPEAEPEEAAETPAEETPPAPTTPEFAAVVAGVRIRLTGILHASIIGTQGVQSFGLPTAVAPTSAVNPAYLPDPGGGELTFQVQQTRLGMIVGEGSDFRGQVEIDFAHFDQSSPTAQAFPRIRIALLSWTFAPDQTLFLGQTWDIFGNATGPQLLSHSFNLVGTLFQSGNIGFMRHQLGWSGKFGDVEVALAAGLQGSNVGPTFNNIEESFTPTGSARLMLHLGDHGVIGISGIGTAIRFTSGMMEERRLALGGELFGDVTLGPVNLHAEAYLAQNLANTGALNIGHGRFGADVADAGGYVSGRLTLGQHAITAMFGGAATLNPDDVVPGYTLPAMPPGLGTPNITLGPGIRWNLSAHVGYWFSPIPGLSIVAEPYVYVTSFALDPTDLARFSPDRVSFGGHLGAMFQF